VSRNGRKIGTVKVIYDYVHLIKIQSLTDTVLAEPEGLSQIIFIIKHDYYKVSAGAAQSYSAGLRAG
jgi:hypothetical protein